MSQQYKPERIDRAAIFLMTLGEEIAVEVFKHLGPKEVQKIGLSMANLSKVPKAHVQSTIADFIHDVQNETTLNVGADEYIRNVLTNALGKEKADTILDRIMISGSSKGLDALRWLDDRSIAELIRHEHPQVVAIILSYLESDQSAGVLSQFPENVRTDLLMRVATLDGVQPCAMIELNNILEKQLHGGGGVQSSSLGGLKAAANILNFVDSSMEAALMEKLKEIDANLGQAIEDLMFVFDNLVDVDDRGIQALLREVQTDTLVLALKGADERVKEKIFKNMSQRAAEMLKDDLENRGPVRLSDVEAAQKEILLAGRRLADAGQIILASAGESML